jgi:tetratricopeptide (TPR) repeat protein
VTRGWEVVRPDDLERIGPWKGANRLPVRERLGISAFGVNAYEAAEPGAAVIDAHDEVSVPGVGGHQELYVVIAGRATFTVGDEEVDAPAGTLVFVGDPEVERGATAEEGTVVLAVGAPAGRPYEVGRWEAGSRAVTFFQRGEFDRARQALLDALERHPDEPLFLYNLACAEARLGLRDEALDHLAGAVADERLRQSARSDSDLDAIRADPRFPG